MLWHTQEQSQSHACQIRTGCGTDLAASCCGLVFGLVACEQREHVTEPEPGRVWAVRGEPSTLIPLVDQFAGLLASHAEVAEVDDEFRDLGGGAQLVVEFGEELCPAVGHVVSGAAAGAFDCWPARF